MYGKPKFPTFTWSSYRPKWNKFLKLIDQLEKDHIHGPKHDQMCCEIARSGVWEVSDHNISYFHYFYSSVGGSGYDDASDADVGSNDEFGIILD